MLTAIRRHVRINRVSPNNYADTATRDDTRGGAPRHAAGEISVARDYKRDANIHFGRRFGTDARGTTTATPGEYFKTAIQAVYPVCRGPFSLFSLLHACSCRAPRPLASSASPRRVANEMTRASARMTNVARLCGKSFRKFPQ